MASWGWELINLMLPSKELLTTFLKTPVREGKVQMFIVRQSNIKPLVTVVEASQFFTRYETIRITKRVNIFDGFGMSCTSFSWKRSNK